MEPSARSEIAPFYVMEVMRAAEAREMAGHEVLHLEVGQPSTPAPEGALAAAERGLRADRLGYTGAAGMPELRSRISGWYRDRHGVHVPDDRIVVTTGASGSCVLAFLALFEAGQRVGVLEPGYPCYRNDLQAFGLEVVEIPLAHDHGFRPTLADLEAAEPLDGLVVASPSNPTGTVVPAHTLAEIVGWADRCGVRLVVDEIYHGISFDIETPTALALSDRVTVFNSFSKYFSMTGWRLGWMVTPPSITDAVVRLAQNLTISAPTLAQMAALAAFDCTDELDANVERYRRNREVVLAGLASAGLNRTAPADGAFFVWADVGHLGLDSQTLCRRWLDELGVAATPGIDFDRRRGDRYVRFSYAGEEAELAEATARIGHWIAEHPDLEHAADEDGANGCDADRAVPAPR